MNDDPNSSSDQTSGDPVCSDGESSTSSSADNASSDPSSAVCTGDNPPTPDSSSAEPSSSGQTSSEPVGPPPPPFIGPPVNPAPGNDPPPSSSEFADADNAAANSCSETPVGDSSPSCSKVNSTLAVKVTDYQNRPISGVDVKVEGVGEGTTDQYGLADFGEVPEGTYSITVWKEGYRPDPNAIVGPVVISGTVPAATAVVIPAQLATFRENIIFIGSEMDYEKFWTKMMFISAAWFEASNGPEFRSADRKTVAYVDEGYTRFEKLTIEYLRQKQGFYVIKLSVDMDIVDVLNTRLKPTPPVRRNTICSRMSYSFRTGSPTASNSISRAARA